LPVEYTEQGEIENIVRSNEEFSTEQPRPAS